MNETKIVSGLHYKTGEPIQVHMTDGVIDRVEPLMNRTMEHAGDLHWIGPGFVDLQINGYSGIDFNHPSITWEDVQAVTRKLWIEGTTVYYPTVITNTDENIEHIVRVISQACSQDRLTANSIAGIHLEGPFISPDDGPRGAHGKAFVKAPDWELFERWQEAANGLIRIVTLSPEWDASPEFIANCVRNGVKVSIGHTAASPEQIRRAVQAGATMSTHLGNGSHLSLPRHHNYIWEQLAQDQLYACMIADGFHLPTAVMKVFMKAKAERLFLVSDAVYLSGLTPGRYNTHIGGEVVLTKEGNLHLANEPAILAGSAQLLKAGIVHLVKAGLCNLATAWEMASVKPAAFMDLTVGLAKGTPADLITFSWDQCHNLILRDVYKQGFHVAGIPAS
jgi:N-acetylglucosamine-6-phosphate deacetylase